jgi:hypothetical protein
LLRVHRVAALSAMLSCGGEGSTTDSARTQLPDTTRGSAALDSAARRVVGFLQGMIAYDSIAIADTVQLRVSPEGGGGAVVMRRDQLRDRARWTVRSGRATFAFAPRSDAWKLTTMVGRHFNCMEYTLATRAPDLATKPHVGAKLGPEDSASCLQTWNVTFVFDTAAGSPRLVAALYDQWEW